MTLEIDQTQLSQKFKENPRLLFLGVYLGQIQKEGLVDVDNVSLSTVKQFIEDLEVLSDTTKVALKDESKIQT